MSMNSTANTTVTHEPLGDSSHVGMWYWAVRWVIGLVTLLGNGLIVIIIVFRRRLHVTTNWLILSLATADLFVGLFVIPGAYFCNFHLSCDWSILFTAYDALLYVSVLNLCAITADRFLAVVYPYRYPQLMTNNTTRVVLLGAWVVPIVLCFIPTTWKHSEESKRRAADKAFDATALVLFEILPCLSMLIIHIPIFVIVRRHSKQIFSQRQQVQQHGLEKKTMISNQKREKSTVKVMALVVLLFVLCYLLSVCRTACRMFKLCDPPFEVVLTSRLLLLANSAMNPFVYALVKKDIRRELKELLRSCRGRERVSPGQREKDSSSIITGNNISINVLHSRSQQQ